MEETCNLGLVLGGGGARAAFQVGVLRGLARRVPDLRFPILTGVSAGSINAVGLASFPGDLEQRIERLTECWRLLSVPRVFESRPLALLFRAFRTGVRMIAGRPRASHFEGMVDSAPLRRFLMEVLESPDGSLPGIARNLARGEPRTVAVTTTSYATAQTVTFYSGGDEIRPWRRPQRRSVRTDLTVDHVMASAALPIFFPSVGIDGLHYGDGGVRLVAPLGPALHLGADRILVVSTGYRPAETEARRPAFRGEPSLAQVLGVLYNSIFLDQLEQDAFMLERINRLVRELPEEKRGELREVELVVIRPSRDIGTLANEYEPELPRTFRYLTRRLGTQRSRNQDFLSTVMFERPYIRELLEIGEADGEAHADEVARKLCG